MKKPKIKRTLGERAITDHVQKRDKIATMKLFQDAALEIIKNEGIEKLKINRLERKTGKSKRLVYAYFGGLDGLLEAVLKSNDPWLGYTQNIASILKLHKGNMGEDLAGILLKNHLVNFYSDGFAQQVSLLELSKKDDPALSSLTRSREELGNRLFAIAERHFEGTDVDIRFVMAILIGGINYLTLHKMANGSTFCGTNIERTEDFGKLCNALEQIVRWAYQNAKKSG